MARLLLVLTLFLTTFGTPVFASDCDGIPSFDTEFKSSDKIFSGQVVSIKPYITQAGQKQFSEFVVELKINKAYKGTTTKNIKVRTAVSIASCGYPFEKGKTFLVYAFLDRNTYRVTYCSRTKEVKNAKEDIDKLSSLAVIDKKRLLTSACCHGSARPRSV